MHSSTYFFTYVSRTITSYPHDYTHECFRYAIEKAKNSAQIVLVRRDNLLHYCYVRKIREKQYFGICFRTDHIYNSVADLFRAFDHVYTEIVYAGILLQVDTNGQVMVGTTEFAKESVEINEQSKHFLNSLRLSSLTTQQLPPADFSISIKDCIDLSIEQSTNSEIIDAIKKYNNVYIVKSQAEIARLTEVTSIIKRKNEEIKQLQDTIIQQDNAISDLKKSKNKYKWVLCLLSFIFIGIIAFYFFAQSKSKIIDDQTDEIENLNSDVQSKNTRIQNLKQNVLSLEKELENANTAIINLKETNELVTDSLKQTSSELNEIYSYFSDIPFVITNIEIANTYKGGAIETNYGYRIYSSNTMYLTPKIKYIGLSSGNRNLRVKLYDSSGNLSKGTFNNKPSPDDCTYSEYFYLSKGKNDCTLVGWGNENKGHWKKGKYRFEIWSDGLCLGIKHFEVY